MRTQKNQNENVWFLSEILIKSEFSFLRIFEFSSYIGYLTSLQFITEGTPTLKPLSIN